MKRKEVKIEEECHHLVQNFRIIEEQLRRFARIYEVDKYKLHIAEIDKIVNLILSLKYRLAPVENALTNVDWNGVDERYHLERKRDKLLDQLEETKLLWSFIDKRSTVVAGYIEQYLSYQEVVQFRQLVKTKVNQIVEMKKIKKAISEVFCELRNIEYL